MIGQSKEELVIEEPVKFGQSSGKVKFLVAIAVVLAVLAVLFIGLYATERKNLKNLEEETASIKQKGSTMTTKTPVTRRPVTRAPGPDLRPSTVQVAASKLPLFILPFCNSVTIFCLSQGSSIHELSSLIFIIKVLVIANSYFKFIFLTR